MWKLIVLGIAGAVGYKLLVVRTGRGNKNAAYADDQPHNFHPDVRDAGPGAMRDICSREWTTTDEALDESFPASDPSGSY